MTVKQVINTRNYRKRNFDNFKCVYCGKPTESSACENCKRRHNARTQYQRWFMRLFK